MIKSTDIFNELLTALDVPHSSDYSARRFDTMTFKSLFGLTKLLADYGVESEGLMATDKPTALAAAPVPLLARVGRKFLIVKAVNPTSVETVDDSGNHSSMQRDRFIDSWSGEMLVLYPSDNAAEPDWKKHRDIQFLSRAKVWVLILLSAFVFVWLMVTGGAGRHISTVLLTAIDLCGLAVTWLLLLKQLGVKSVAAESVCSVIEAGGCNTVLATKASKFFGLFGWSEVGFAYFSVSLAALLVFPQSTGWLAAINLCCLPFSFWSVWYQKFRAGAWCTLCLIVQSLLWLSFFCYLGGGWFRFTFPLHIGFFILGSCYVIALLALNRLLAGIEYYRNLKKTD